MGSNPCSTIPLDFVRCSRRRDCRSQRRTAAADRPGGRIGRTRASVGGTACRNRARGGGGGVARTDRRRRASQVPAIAANHRRANYRLSREERRRLGDVPTGDRRGCRCARMGRALVRREDHLRRRRRQPTPPEGCARPRHGDRITKSRWRRPSSRRGRGSISNARLPPLIRKRGSHERSYRRHIARTRPQ
jgi:hypothetical protein